MVSFPEYLCLRILHTRTVSNQVTMQENVRLTMVDLIAQPSLEIIIGKIAIYQLLSVSESYR